MVQVAVAITVSYLCFMVALLLPYSSTIVETFIASMPFSYLRCSGLLHGYLVPDHNVDGFCSNFVCFWFGFHKIILGQGP